MPHNKVLLCILDGFGIGDESLDNAIFKEAKNYNRFKQNYSFTSLEASEEYVGLPKGQMGNSEVGHMTIGLGRVLFQDLLKIENAFNNQIIQTHKSVRQAVLHLKNSQKTCHVMGLLSPGGVHSHQDHILKIVDFLCQNQVHVSFHAFLDGRDTPPQSACDYIQQVQDKFKDNPYFKWGTLIGRYFAMDRDNRFERTEKAYKAIVLNEGIVFNDPILAIRQLYEKGQFDEFIEPLIFEDYKGIEDDDVIWITNFRADRVRQILNSLLVKDFSYFKREHIVDIHSAIGFYDYSQTLSECSNFYALFKKDKNINCLSDVISQHKLKQLHIAETEKYAHVTFFFNGGREEPCNGEDRILIESPKVATYDLEPEMSAFKILDQLQKAILSDSYHLIVVNFANADMVGHTGKKDAVETAIKTIDSILNELETLSLKNNIKLIISADHGNAECLMDETTHQPHTAHTLNKVPFVLIDKNKYSLKNTGTLADIAPTILELMNIEKPNEMTGKSLILK